MQPQYIGLASNQKQMGTVYIRQVLDETKVVFNTRNWMTTSCLNIEMMWVGTFGKKHLPWRIINIFEGISTDDFRNLKEIIKDAKKKFISIQDSENESRNAKTTKNLNHRRAVSDVICCWKCFQCLALILHKNYDKNNYIYY